jgi:seryl-tRNA synthetase
MLDIKFIKENAERVQNIVDSKKNKSNINISELLERYEVIQKKTVALETLRSKRNDLNDQIKRNKDEVERNKLIQENSKLKNEVKDLENDLESLQANYMSVMVNVPNVIAEDVPLGKDDTENVILRQWGTPRVFDFTPQNHYELGVALDLIDTETSAKVSGPRFAYLKNELVFLQFAIIQYVMNKLTDIDFITPIAEKTGVKNTLFTPVIPPVIAKAEVVKKMDRFDPIDDRYYFEDDQAMFVGSAEHTLGPMFMDHTFKEEELPVRLIGYSSAFRREAGTYGVDTVGLFRRHQFDKLEMESFCLPEKGYNEQEFFLSVQEALVQGLNIPYELMMKCVGDMGRPDYREVDLNCWFPGYNRYRETHTSDYMTDYQSRRLNTRVKLENGDKSYVHMNDATAFAIGRIIIAIMENYQNKDGSITVPEALRRYTGFEVIKKVV